MISKLAYQSMDAVMYAMMNLTQWQLRHDVSSKEKLELYLKECAPLNRDSYFAFTPMQKIVEVADGFSWQSPLQTSFHENNRAQTLFFPAFGTNPSAPTLIILHALMSASDGGYRRIAKRMNQRGWNVLFPHLPFHYSRRPRHHNNGALAITADLVRNGETLRQAVQELRQLMAWARGRGSSKLGLLATSYGGWIASLLLSLEEVDFALLLQPITDIPYVTFQSPIARVMASLLAARGISSEHLERHAPLTAPLFGKPRCLPERMRVIGGRYDRISTPDQLRYFCHHWNIPYDEVEQGHFGYEGMKRALETMNFFIN